MAAAPPPPPQYTALARPIRADATGSLARVSDLDAIRAAVEELMGTVPGERPMRPEWGSLARTRLFEPNDPLLEQLLIDDTAEAIKRWEPRVIFRGAAVARDGRGTRVTATFVVRGTRPAVVGTAGVTFAQT
jgi:phage baseplate assembly protein W